MSNRKAPFSLTGPCCALSPSFPSRMACQMYRRAHEMRSDWSGYHPLSSQTVGPESCLADSGREQPSLEPFPRVREFSFSINPLERSTQSLV